MSSSSNSEINSTPINEANSNLSKNTSLLPAINQHTDSSPRMPTIIFQTQGERVKTPNDGPVKIRFNK